MYELHAHESGDIEWEKYTDDRIGKGLKASEVIAARMSVIRMLEMGAYVNVARHVARQRGKRL